jgi:YD repeat-containing protein
VELIASYAPLDRTTGYAYDAAGHLVSVTDPLNKTTTYGYDAADRRTTMVLTRSRGHALGRQR